MKKKGKSTTKRHVDGNFFTYWFGKISSLPHRPLCLQYIVTISIDFYFRFYTRQSILTEQKPSKLLIYNLKIEEASTKTSRQAHLSIMTRDLNLTQISQMITQGYISIILFLIGRLSDKCGSLPTLNITEFSMGFFGMFQN